MKSWKDWLVVVVVVLGCVRWAERWEGAVTAEVER